MKENEQLSMANRQIRLQGLKSQVNPHFLFNSLNSLSSLVDEDEDKAEKFLDELSKVYRYMLRTEDDELVTLDAELAFTASYYYLLKARYGEGLDMKIDVCHNDLEKYLPPLTLQTIIENAFMQNSMQPGSPLVIRIESNGKNLTVINNLQPKIIGEDRDIESGIDNLVARYSLLHHSAIIIQDDDVVRTIQLPLFHDKNDAAV
jgi:LytS/YehU family sensor histidine kinase